MLMFPFRKTVFVLVGVLLLAGGAYVIFGGESEPIPELNSSLEIDSSPSLSKVFRRSAI